MAAIADTMGKGAEVAMVKSGYQVARKLLNATVAAKGTEVSLKRWILEDLLRFAIHRSGEPVDEKVVQTLQGCLDSTPESGAASKGDVLVPTTQLKLLLLRVAKGVQRVNDLAASTSGNSSASAGVAQGEVPGAPQSGIAARQEAPQARKSAAVLRYATSHVAAGVSGRESSTGKGASTSADSGSSSGAQRQSAGAEDAKSVPEEQSGDGEPSNSQSTSEAAWPHQPLSSTVWREVLLRCHTAAAAVDVLQHQLKRCGTRNVAALSRSHERLHQLWSEVEARMMAASATVIAAMPAEKRRRVDHELLALHARSTSDATNKGGSDLFDIANLASRIDAVLLQLQEFKSQHEVAHEAVNSSTSSTTSGTLVKLSGIPPSMNEKSVSDLLGQFGGPVRHVEFTGRAENHQGHGVAEYITRSSAEQAVSFSPLLGKIQVELVQDSPDSLHSPEAAASEAAACKAAGQAPPAEEQVAEEATTEMAAAHGEAAEREAAEREAAEREAAEKEAAEREAAEKEAAEREAAEKEAADREAAEKTAAEKDAAEREVAIQEAADKEAAEREAVEREVAEKEAADREAADTEAADGDAAEKAAAEKEAIQRELAEREAADREAAEREAVEKAAAEKEAAEREATEKEVAEREAAEREAAEGEVAEKEAADREAVDTEIADREVAEKAAVEKEAVEREAAEREAAEKEAAEREAARQVAEKAAAEKDAAERESAEKEAVEREAAEKEAADREAAEKAAIEKEAVEREAAEKETAEKEAAESEAADREAAQKAADDQDPVERELAEEEDAEKTATEKEVSEREAATRQVSPDVTVTIQSPSLDGLPEDPSVSLLGAAAAAELAMPTAEDEEAPQAVLAQLGVEANVAPSESPSEALSAVPSLSPEEPVEEACELLPPTSCSDAIAASEFALPAVENSGIHPEDSGDRNAVSDFFARWLSKAPPNPDALPFEALEVLPEPELEPSEPVMGDMEPNIEVIGGQTAAEATQEPLGDAPGPLAELVPADVVMENMEFLGGAEAAPALSSPTHGVQGVFELSKNNSGDRSRSRSRSKGQAKQSCTELEAGNLKKKLAELKRRARNSSMPTGGTELETASAKPVVSYAAEAQPIEQAAAGTTLSTVGDIGCESVAEEAAGDENGCHAPVPPESAWQ